MLFKNIYVYNSGIKELKHLWVSEEGFLQIFDINEDLSHLNEKKIINCNSSYYLMPGLLDAHVHGQGGIDFADLREESTDEEIETILAALGKTGLSYAVATLVSLPIPDLKKALKRINDFVHKNEQNPTPGSAQLVAVHLEGPFISEPCKGAHAKEALQKTLSMEMFRDIIQAAPDIKQWKMTIAAGIDGDEAFMNEVKDLEQEKNISVKVFIGHCNPEDKNSISRLIKLGVSGHTHLGNACQETCSRETRALALTDANSHPVQWVLENPESPAVVELIVDGEHLSPSFVSLIAKTINNKIMLVTDALGPTGCKEGLYKLGALSIRKEKNSFYLADEEGKIKMKKGVLPTGEEGQVKSLAGSGATLAHCAQKYVEILSELSQENCMDSLYSALITNPRNTSLSAEAIRDLPDDKNFSIFNTKGQLLWSLCNGKLREHQKLSGTTYSHRFLSSQPIEKTNDFGIFCECK